jgi:hypothetical protein
MTMRRPTGAAVLLLALTALSAPGAPRPAAVPVRARDILPPEGLIAGSVAALRDHAALDAHYYLADETILGLGPKTDAVLARYEAGSGESLLLVAVYSTAAQARLVYGRFGGDFFSGAFDPQAPRFVEKLETGDWAGAARRGRCLIVVLESPGREACDGLLRRAEDRAPAEAR